MKTEKILTLITLSLALLAAGARAAVSFGDLPLWFEAGPQNTFVSRGPGTEFRVTAAGAEFSLARSGGPAARCFMQFSGGSQSSRIAGLQPLPGKINRFDGNTAKNWQLNTTLFGRIQIDEIYPGINVVFYGNQERLEYDFNLAPGADSAQIRLHFTGAKTISVARDGSLVIQLDGGKIIQHPPLAFQNIHGATQPVSARYQMIDANTVGFALGNYDRNQPLVIDPVLAYSTYFGGRYGDTPAAVATGPDGSVYVAGQTFSPWVSNNIPLATPAAFSTNYHGGKLTGDAFVLRFDATGTNLIYATYLGGSGNDGALGLAVDAGGNAFLTGFTDSTNFPVTNALYSQINSSPIRQLKAYATDAFVAELNPAGDALLYSTYLGGNSMDAAYGIALDGADNAYVTGYTYSTNYPVTPGAFQSTLQCSNTVYFNANAFVSVITAGGASLSYSTYLGGTNFDTAKTIAYNNSRVFVAGFTTSSNFPGINRLPDYQFLNGDARTNRQKNEFIPTDAFVTAFDASAPTLTVLYSTLLGGTNNDAANSIAADAAGNAYVAGYTMSTNFPYTTTNVPGLTPAFVHTNDFKKRFTLATNGFLTQIKWNGSAPAIGYSSMFGGVDVNVANGVTLDAAGNAYVVGSASCTNWPVTTNNIYPPLSSTNNSRKKGGRHLSDAVVIAFNPDATALLFSAYLGGRENDYGNAIALSPDDSLWLAGWSTSTNFPTVNPWKSYRTGTNDMFIAKISPDSISTLSILPVPGLAASGASLRFAAPAARPSDITVRWRVPVSGGRLESTTDMSRTNWHPVPGNPQFTNGWYQLDRPATNASEFFRVGRP